jgi:hypothetical protein
VSRDYSAPYDASAAPRSHIKKCLMLRPDTEGQKPDTEGQKPFFDPGGSGLQWLYDPADGTPPNITMINDRLVGSQGVRNTLLCEMFPSRTLAAGRVEVQTFGGGRNINMNEETFENSWPPDRLAGLDFDWKHCDLREVAYVYVRQLFTELVNRGGLK